MRMKLIGRANRSDAICSNYFSPSNLFNSRDFGCLYVQNTCTVDTRSLLVLDKYGRSFWHMNSKSNTSSIPRLTPKISNTPAKKEKKENGKEKEEFFYVLMTIMWIVSFSIKFPAIPCMNGSKKSLNKKGSVQMKLTKYL